MEEKHLEHGEAIKRLQGLVAEVKVCMMATVNEDYSIYSRPMQQIETDKEGNIWFFTNEHSGKVDSISEDNTVYLMFSHPGNNTYLHVKGKGFIISDHNTIKEKWSPIIKAWFPEGENDPNLALLKISVLEASYWEGSSNRFVTFYHIAKALATGNRYNEGEYGTLEL